MKTRLLVLLFVPLLLWSAVGCTEKTGWEQYMDAAKAAYQRGDYDESSLQTQLALGEMERVGAHDPRYIFTINKLVAIYRKQGRSGAAERLLTRALPKVKEAFRPDHPDVATALNDLAQIYYAQGRYGEAMPLYQRTLIIREKTFGRGHPDVATIINNMADLYREQGRYGKAEPLYRQSLAIFVLKNMVKREPLCL